MVFIGIDPGKSGAMALIDDLHGTVRVFPFDEASYRLAALSTSGKKALAVVEDVHAMPKQGVTSMFNFGLNKGWILGILYSNAIPTELVRPQKWKRMFSLDGDKAKSIACAQRLFPTVSLLPTPKCRKPNDGMAEALLMAEYARRITDRGQTE